MQGLARSKGIGNKMVKRGTTLSIIITILAGIVLVINFFHRLDSKSLLIVGVGVAVIAVITFILGIKSQNKV